MNKNDIWDIALRQSAKDFGCKPSDFLSQTNTIVTSRICNEARKYLPLPLECDIVSYGNCLVAQTSARAFDAVSKYISTYPPEHAFETPHLHELDNLLLPLGLKVCFMAEYFLPDLEKLKTFDCPYELRILKQADLAHLYRDEWSNALCEKRKELDVLGIGAYDGEKLIGLAGCSADCNDMYQIGIDVLPEYRRKGVASSLTSRLALEILKLGKVPFYCAAWCNIKSVRNAIKCGFVPAWVEITAKSIDFVEEMNNVK